MSNAPHPETLDPNNETLAAQARTDAFLHQVNEQITLGTFDPNDAESLQRLVEEGLGDTRGLVRLRAAETLGDIGEPATPFLVKALANHADVVVRRAAAKTLTLIADPTAVPTLLKAFLYDEDTVVQGSAAGALARTGETAVPALLEILAASEHPESTKGHAAWALAFIGAEAAELLYPALESDSVDVRCAAVGAIAQVAQEKNDVRACEQLVSALTDAAAVIRTEAAAALGQLNYAPALPHLILALRDADSEVRQAAVTTLGKVGDATTLAPLQSMLEDPMESIRVLAKLAMGQIERRQA
ncbi:HEAT repeat domain-containing protein [Synechococcales cyanobacterium C]|uniref:HEAT repeat domain-containing protein n=1 Tax=Petrachloros mirabilis ULC683 TaxID=2781853 RepID=A0A8K2A6P6_9CYAN|nr:HEAT repeat domain-containing protein [Petrachloros mirabilis]NCJ06081.1 HEAT repeat domain-containing protein [Petrachloros mirabilis ULC683]